jgi:hypothetical protein
MFQHCNAPLGGELSGLAAQAGCVLLLFNRPAAMVFCHGGDRLVSGVSALWRRRLVEIIDWTWLCVGVGGLVARMSWSCGTSGWNGCCFRRMKVQSS